MNGWSIFIVLALLVCIIVAYIIEVVIGSRLEVYNAELGAEADCGKRTRLSNREFFFRYLPIILGVAGLLFLLGSLTK